MESLVEFVWPGIGLEYENVLQLPPNNDRTVRADHIDGESHQPDVEATGDFGGWRARHYGNTAPGRAVFPPGCASPRFQGTPLGDMYRVDPLD